MKSAIPLVLVSCLGLPWAALASVGTVSALEGGARRQSASGPAQPLAVGAAIELGDTLEVSAGSNLEVTLNDSSVLALAENSRLKVDEASFAGQERKGFAASLSLGSVWAKVTKALAGSSAKFEVSTERAVAGVRGTIFQVDAGDERSGKEAVVAVKEGQVEVRDRHGASGPMLVGAGEAARVDAHGLRRAPPPPRSAHFERFVGAREKREVQRREQQQHRPVPEKTERNETRERNRHR